MTALVFTAQADADAFSAKVDADNGYPLPGVPCGAGPHFPGDGITSHYGTTMKHPTLAQWAYPWDTPVQAIEAKPATGAVTVLDATWFPVVQVAQAEVPIG